MSTLHQIGKLRKIYRIEGRNSVNEPWSEVCPRQPSIDAAAVKHYKLQKKGKWAYLRIVEQEA